MAFMSLFTVCPVPALGFAVAERSTLSRLSSRYRGQGACEPPRGDLVDGNDAAVFFQPARRGSSY